VQERLPGALLAVREADPPGSPAGLRSVGHD
jgi:hypothetical protein